jgi:3-oxoacyl-[acyl-carrier-protein] synthase-1
MRHRVRAGRHATQVKARLFAARPVSLTGALVAGPRAATGQRAGDVAVGGAPAAAATQPQQRAGAGALAQIRPAVDAAIARFGADRVGVVIGTSTSGIAETEGAMRRMPWWERCRGLSLRTAGNGFAGRMLAMELALTGPAYVHSSACSSSAKAMASAAR